MQYTVSFFVVSAKEAAHQMSHSTSEVLEKARCFLDEWCKVPEAIDPIMEAAERICQGNIPTNAEQPYFDALFTLLSVLGEHIVLGSFQFNNIPYINDVGIWPWTQYESPPFPLPRSEEPLPEYGFLSCERMKSVVLPGLERLPPSKLSGLKARNEFREIVESVVRDGLDLVTYFAVW